jgi:hypothetical protein
MGTRLSSNTPYTPAQLAAFFPTATTPQVLSTIEFARRLVQEGQIDDGQYEQIQQAVSTYIATLAESYTLGAPTIVGGAGTTARRYRIVPAYALPAVYGPGASMTAALGYPVAPSTPAGILPFRMWPGAPPQGFPAPSPAAVASNTVGGRTRCYGNMQAIVAAATTPAVLSATDYVQLTMPAANADFPDIGFDVLVSDGASGPFYGIGFGIPASATFNDIGQSRLPYSLYDPNNHSAGNPVRYFQPEVGVDTTTTPHTKLYAINTTVAPWVETTLTQTAALQGQKPAATSKSLVAAGKARDDNGDDGDDDSASARDKAAPGRDDSGRGRNHNDPRARR